jgi:hypothetical protein
MKDTDFMNGQCFNFAYAICETLRDQACYSNVAINLVLIVGERFYLHEPETVCIHCFAQVSQAKDNKVFLIDAQGIHDGSYIEDISEHWQAIEYEIHGYLGEVEFFEYDFNVQEDIESYWQELSLAGAFKDLRIIEAAADIVRSQEEFYLSLCVGGNNRQTRMALESI